ncbi:MAG: DUF4351 domain-containing protein [Cyanobacteriota bacterium]|nr:DUF4351 domain-containing protein [Cyanobacteriota bacterium]
MEIVTSWMEQGIQLGIILGELKIIRRQIHTIIGEINPQLMEKFNQLPEPKLVDLAEALLDLSTEENLATWLQQNADN